MNIEQRINFLINFLGIVGGGGLCVLAIIAVYIVTHPTIKTAPEPPAEAACVCFRGSLDRVDTIENLEKKYREIALNCYKYCTAKGSGSEGFCSSQCFARKGK